MRVPRSAGDTTPAQHIPVFTFFSVISPPIPQFNLKPWPPSSHSLCTSCWREGDIYTFSYYSMKGLLMWEVIRGPSWRRTESVPLLHPHMFDGNACISVAQKGSIHCFPVVCASVYNKIYAIKYCVTQYVHIMHARDKTEGSVFAQRATIHSGNHKLRAKLKTAKECKWKKKREKQLFINVIKNELLKCIKTIP